MIHKFLLGAGSMIEEQLVEFLFNNYTKHVHPTTKVNGVVRVQFIVTLLQLIR